MSLVNNGETRIIGISGAIDLVVYGFSADETNSIMRRIPSKPFRRGEVFTRLTELERKRTLSDGFSTSLSRKEVRALVRALPCVLDSSRRAPGASLPMLDLEEMRQRATGFVRSFRDSLMSAKLMRMSREEWKVPRRLFAE